MSFITDPQTLKDLNILGKYRRDSIFSLYNETQTYGGERLLEDIFRNPMSDISALQRRSAIIGFFREQEAFFTIDPDDLELFQNFVPRATEASYVKSLYAVGRLVFLRKIGVSQDHKLFEASVRAVLRMTAQLQRYLQALDAAAGKDIISGTPLDQSWIRGTTQLSTLAYEVEQHEDKLPAALAIRCDYYLRQKWSASLQEVLDIIYYIDCYQSIAAVANAKHFVAATALPAHEQVLYLRQLVHPTVPKAIGNDLRFDKGNNLIFLTGANMAGKSTYMKSLGVAVYLAHIGLPVSAAEMHFSIKDGLYTSINVEDNLHLGHSHYYAEVLRVKTVAEAVHQGKQLVVIFDELFKGTNVKDAFEATLAVTRAFQQHHSCQYLISTHIVEVGERLRAEASGMQFLYLPTIMNGQVPTYPYTTAEGISNDKHGMVLINKEHILELLEKSRTIH